MGMFVLSQPIAMMIAGPLAGLLLGMDGIANLRLAMVVCCSWLARGFIGFTYLLWLPDNIDKVKWLSIEQNNGLK